MLTKSCKKVANYFECVLCDYHTSRKSSWNKHLSTHKHLMLTNANKSCKSCTKKPEYFPLHQCSGCGKGYKHKSSLCRHRKSCAKLQELVNKDKVAELQAKAILYDEQKEHINELKTLMQNISCNNTTANFHNNVQNNVNINIILNTQCKDAMNISDFVEHLHLSLDDLLYTGNNGYIEGVSNIFIKGLNELEPNKRPIHCSNERGNNLYIRDDNKWEKDGDGKMLDSQIDAVTKKHIDILKAWEQAHPNWQNNEKETNTYILLVQQMMGGTSEEERNKKHKIIQKNISKCVKIHDIVSDNHKI